MLKYKAKKLRLLSFMRCHHENTLTKKDILSIFLPLPLINIIRTAFMPVAPKRVRIQSSCQCLFTLLGSTGVKAVRKTLVKLTPCVDITNVLLGNTKQGKCRLTNECPFFLFLIFHWHYEKIIFYL